jgi:hypothetical protein
VYQWDATSLITCAKFQIGDRLMLDYALGAGVVSCDDLSPLGQDRVTTDGSTKCDANFATIAGLR